jgi:peroxiredoxin
MAHLFFLPFLFLGDTQDLGKSIANFTLKDTNDKHVSLAQFKDKKAIVVIFLGTQCPINNLYAPRLAELHKEFADKDVQFLAINSNRQDSLPSIIEHAKKNRVPFPVLRDDGNVIADRFGAQRTPEAFILDHRQTIRYQGRIDDQYGFDYQRKQPTRRDLVEALQEVLAGKEVSQPKIAVAGCYIGRVAKTRVEGTVTFTKHIAPLLQKHCQECHRPGQVGPMSLLHYDDAVSWAAMIREVVADKRMPPWYADPRFGKFTNDRTLPREDRDLLLAWIDQGTPRGDDKDLPRPRQFPEGWQIGTPDLIISMPKEFQVPAEMPRGGVPYQFFMVDTNFDEDKWIDRAEARPGSPEVVHHILVFIIPPGQIFNPAGSATPVLCGMAPGEQPLNLQQGVAKLIPKGSRLLFQLHYTPNGQAQTDKSSIGLIFAKKPPEKVVRTQPIFNALFRIPPHAENYEVESSYVFKKDGFVAGYMPHMHVRGKDFLIKAIYPDGKEETLLYVPRFNFNWQGVYRPYEPLPMPQGTKIVCIAHFDNSRNNPNNPDPDRPVFWGDQTWQEMMIGWVDLAFDLPLEQPQGNNNPLQK